MKLVILWKFAIIKNLNFSMKSAILKTDHANKINLQLLAGHTVKILLFGCWIVSQL